MAVTSEDENELSATQRASGFTGEVIVDPENLLAKELKKRRLLDVAISEKNGYPNGMAQPAVLVMNREKNVLFNWAIFPAVVCYSSCIWFPRLGLIRRQMNFRGAKDRPDLTQIWDNMEARLQGQPAVHKAYKTQGALVGIGTKVFG